MRRADHGSRKRDRGTSRGEGMMCQNVVVKEGKMGVSGNCLWKGVAEHEG
jgi:hypothetical protein